MIIKLVRHGQSEVNAGITPYGSKGDYQVVLTEQGIEEAKAAGDKIGADFFRHAIVYRSPYMRTRQTCDHLLHRLTENLKSIRGNKSLKIYEDPRLREMDHGYSDVEAQETMRKTHGWFYYRFNGGESPSDCYDRCCHFLESMMRQVNRKQDGFNGADPNVLIVCHGMTIRCFIARFMHLSVEEFESLANPKNCDIITIAPAGGFVSGQTVSRPRSLYDVEGSPQFTSGRWGVNGLRFRPKETE